MSDSTGLRGERGWKVDRWPVFVIAVIVAVLLYVMIFVLPRPELTLQYLKALVWPVVVATFLYWVRDPLKAKVEQLLSLGAFGAEARFAATTERLQANVEGAAASVLAVDERGEREADVSSPGDADGGGRTDSSADVDSETTATQPPSSVGPESDNGSTTTSSAPQANAQHLLKRRREERQRRLREQEAIERIIQESAAWGYEMAHLGFKSVPVPAIVWTEDGRPIIKYGKGDDTGRRTVERYNKEEKVRRLEDEIRTLQGRVDEHPFGVPALTNQKYIAERMRLEDMKNQLSALDPNSPFAN